MGMCERERGRGRDIKKENIIYADLHLLVNVDTMLHYINYSKNMDDL